MWHALHIRLRPESCPSTLDASSNIIYDCLPATACIKSSWCLCDRDVMAEGGMEQDVQLLVRLTRDAIEKLY